MKQQRKVGFDKDPAERMRQSHILDNTRLAGWYLVIKDHKVMDVKHRHEIQLISNAQEQYEF